MRPNFIIIGNFRSGTTLVSNIINSNPNCHSITEGYIYLFQSLQKKIVEKIYKKKLKNFELFYNYEKYPKIIKYLNKEKFIKFKIDDKEKKNILKNISKLSYINPHLKKLNINKQYNLKNLLEEFTSQILKKSTKKKVKIVGFKCSWIEDYIPIIIKNYPNIKIINIVRNPINMIESAINSDTGINLYKGKRPLLYYLGYWKKSMKSLSHYKKKILILKYEDFKKNNYKFKNKIFKHLNINYKNTNILYDELGNVWDNNSSFKNNKTSSKKKYLSKDIKYLINKLCKSELLKLGYKVNKNYKDLDKKKTIKIIKLFDNKFSKNRLKKFLKFKNYEKILKDFS